jgi:hypothetical protein
MLTREQIEAMYASLEQQAAQLHEELHKAIGAMELCQHWLAELDNNKPADEQAIEGD